MARSSTSFGPGNQHAFKKGNRLAVKHGAYSIQSVEERYPEVLARIEAELASNPLPGQPVDGSVLRMYARMVARAEMHFEWFDLNGGPLTESGAYRPGWMGLMQLVDRIEKFARLNGIGALPRAQTLQQQANASLNALEVRAAQERLRAKQAMKVLPGGA